MRVLGREFTFKLPLLNLSELVATRKVPTTSIETRMAWIKTLQIELMIGKGYYCHILGTNNNDIPINLSEKELDERHKESFRKSLKTVTATPEEETQTSGRFLLVHQGISMAYQAYSLEIDTTAFFSPDKKTPSLDSLFHEPNEVEKRKRPYGIWVEEHTGQEINDHGFQGRRGLTVREFFVYYLNNKAAIDKGPLYARGSVYQIFDRQQNRLLSYTPLLRKMQSGQVVLTYVPYSDRLDPNAQVPTTFSVSDTNAIRRPQYKN